MRFRSEDIVRSQLRRLKLMDLEPILRKWIDLNKEYYERVEKPSDSCPWMLNERPTVGILSAAAWQSGCIALEEFSLQKRKKTKGEKYAGRCDLRIQTKRNEFYIEAKQIKTNIKRGNKDIGEEEISRIIKKTYSRIRESYRKAFKDARKLKTRDHNRPIRRIGLCFIVPKVGWNEPQADINNKLSQLTEILEKRKKGLVAWYFVNKAADLYKVEGDYLYPGVLLLIKEIGKKNI